MKTSHPCNSFGAIPVPAALLLIGATGAALFSAEPTGVPAAGRSAPRLDAQKPAAAVTTTTLSTSALAEVWIRAVKDGRPESWTRRQDLADRGKDVFDALLRLYGQPDISNDGHACDVLLGRLRALDSDRALAFFKREVLPKGSVGAKAEVYSILGIGGPPETVALLVKGLEETDPKVSFEVQRSLMIRANDVLPAVVEVLAKGSDRARLNAVQSLNGIGHRFSDEGVDARKTEVTTAMRKALSDPSTGVRGDAARNLSELDPAALSECLASPDPAVRAGGLQSKSIAANTPEVLRAARDPDSVVRKHAAAAMAHWSSETSQALLLELVRDPQPEVREAARSAVISHGAKTQVDRIKPLLSDKEPEIAGLAVTLLARSDALSVDQLLDLANDPQAPTPVRQAATWAVMSEGRHPRVQQLMRDLLADPARLSWAVGCGRARRYPPDVLVRTDYPPWPFSQERREVPYLDRNEAALILLTYGNDDDLLRILDAVNAGHMSPWTCGVFFTKGDAAIPALLTALKSDRGEVRLAAVSALLHLYTDERARAGVLATLSDPDEQVRAHCAFAVGCKHDAAAKDALRPLVNDPSEIVRAFAGSGLLMLGDRTGCDSAFAWHRKRVAYGQGVWVDFYSALFLLKYATPIGTTRAQASQYFPYPSGTSGETVWWSYDATGGMDIAFRFEKDVLVEMNPAPNRYDKDFP